jgi:hypothetical protein
MLRVVVPKKDKKNFVSNLNFVKKMGAINYLIEGTQKIKN